MTTLTSPSIVGQGRLEAVWVTVEICWPNPLTSESGAMPTVGLAADVNVAGALDCAKTETVRMNADVKNDAIVRMNTPFPKVDADRFNEWDAANEKTFRVGSECRILA